jgi:hypothetical protein
MADKLPRYVTALNLPPAQVAAGVAACKFAIYVLGEWLPAVRSFGPAATSEVEALFSGEGASQMALPVFRAPALPEGVGPVPTGALTRLFELVQLIKNSTGYNEVIGRDLGIVAPTTTTPAPGDSAAPPLTCKLVEGQTNQAVNLGFRKNKHMGVYIESQRGAGPLAYLAIATQSPYHDDRPLLVAGTPEVRQYRLRYWDKGHANGDWSDTAAITVGP